MEHTLITAVAAVTIANIPLFVSKQLTRDGQTCQPLLLSRAQQVP
jgi:hypothetical protein